MTRFSLSLLFGLTFFLSSFAVVVSAASKDETGVGLVLASWSHRVNSTTSSRELEQARCLRRCETIRKKRNKCIKRCNESESAMRRKKACRDNKCTKRRAVKRCFRKCKEQQGDKTSIVNDEGKKEAVTVPDVDAKETTTTVDNPTAAPTSAPTAAPTTADTEMICTQALEYCGNPLTLFLNGCGPVLAGYDLSTCVGDPADADPNAYANPSLFSDAVIADLAEWPECLGIKGEDCMELINGSDSGLDVSIVPHLTEAVVASWDHGKLLCETRVGIPFMYPHCYATTLTNPSLHSLQTRALLHASRL